jgi:two-component system, cell cycle response regulator
MSTSKNALKELTVLYVEDEESVQLTLATILRRRFKEVITANDGQAGLDIFQEKAKEIDLVITDISMPRLNGLKMAREIKRINKAMPIIITTSYNDVNMMSKSINAVHVDGYLTKPIDQTQLDQILIDATQKHELYCHDEETLDLHSFMEMQENMVVILNHQNQFIEVNSSFLDFIGFTSLTQLQESDISLNQLFIKHKSFLNSSLVGEEFVDFILQEHKHSFRVLMCQKEEQSKPKPKADVFVLSAKSDIELDKVMITLTKITGINQEIDFYKEKASKDQQTQVLDRSAIETKMRELIIDEPILIQVTLTNLAQLTNLYGPNTIDFILPKTADFLKKHIRDHDFIGRLDKKSFLIILMISDVQISQP